MAFRTPAQKSAINRMLGTHGLPPLESGAGLMVALGYMVQDHEHFRSLLVRCEPEERTNMYNSLAPNLRFPARPLDTYIAESAQLAEQRKLPTVQEGGDYKWPSDARPSGLCACKGPVLITFNEDYVPMCRTCRRPVPSPDGAIAQDAVNWAFAKYQLALVCMKCTKEQVFSGDTKADAVLAARNEGWAYWERGEGQPHGEICPECPASSHKN